MPAAESTQLLPFLVSLALGFLIGLERERSKNVGGALGLRTFTLLALLGSVAGALREAWLAAVLAAASLGLVLLAYFRETKPGRHADRGLTTEIAACLVFALSYFSHGNAALVALLSCIAALLLFWKARLHRFSEKLRPRELEAALVLLLVGIAVLGFSVDKAIDPWGLLNPRKFGLIVLMLGGIEFASYVAVKVIGPRKSPLVIGFLAGIASSTALTVSIAHRSRRHPSSWRVDAAMVVSGKIASLLLLAVLAGGVSGGLALPAGVMVGAAALAGGAGAWLLLGGQERIEGPAQLGESPLNVRGVLRLSVLLAAVLGVVALAQHFSGALGRNAAAALAGLFELHGVSLATATLHSQERLSTAEALTTLRIAVFADLAAKASIAAFLARNRFAAALGLVLLAMGGAAALATFALPAP